MKKFYLTFTVAIVLQINGFTQTTFPLDIGNKWYYQAGSNRNEVYGIVKEVTDTISNGFREITCKNLASTGVFTTTEYWGYIDGKLYFNSYSPAIDYYTQVYYNNFLTHDTCIYIGGSNMANDCWELIEYQIFNIMDSAQVYTRGGAIASIVSFLEKVIISRKSGIVRTWFSSYPRDGNGVRDSTYLIGMYRNGELFGDTVFYNPYRAANLFSPLNGSRDMFLTVSLQWHKPSEAVSYRLLVSKDTIFSDLIVDYSGLTDTLKVVGPLEDFTEYYWRVGTLSSNGIEYWSSYFNFRTMNTKNIPYLVFPEDGTIIPQLSTFKWRKAEEGVSYSLQISTDFHFNNLVYDRWDLTDTIKTIDALKLDTKYFWRVGTFSSDGIEYWSQVWQFTIVDFSYILVSPTNNSTELTIPVGFKWSGVPNILNYQLQVSTNSSFNDSLLDFPNLTDTSYTVNSLNSANQYFWRSKNNKFVGL